MLTLWTSSETQHVRRVADPVFTSMPEVEGRCVEFSQFEPLVPREGEVVLAMGGRIHQRLQEWRVAPGNLSLGKVRGRLLPAGEGAGHYMVTYDPFMADRSPQFETDIQWDLRLAGRWLTTGSLEPTLGRYRYVDSFADAIAAVERLYDERDGRPVPVTEDLETLGLDPWADGAWIVSIQITVEEGTADVMVFPEPGQAPTREQLEEIRWLESSPKVSLGGAGLKFDNVWKAVHWGLPSPPSFRADTLLIGGLNNENVKQSLNVQAKIWTPLGGYDDCVAPGTRVLTADLRWVGVEDVRPGDELVGFDEVAPGPRLRRKLRVATAESNRRLVKSGVEVRLSDGRAIRCSADHGFLVASGRGGGCVRWRRAHQLRRGQRLKVAAPVEEFDLSREAGWMAGFLDGEGYVSYQGAGMTLGWSQAPGQVWDRAHAYADALGLGGYYARQKNGDGVKTSKLSTWGALRLLQAARPGRLLSKRPYAGKAIPTPRPEARVYVDSVVPIGDMEVISLQTSTRTFVAEGVCSHNSFNSRHDKGRMDLVLAKDPEGFLQYAGGDTDAGQRVRPQVLRQLREDPGLVDFYVQILHPAAVAFERVERGGILVDEAQLRNVGRLCEEEAADARRQMNSLVPPRVRLKHAEGFSYTKPSVIRDIFFSRQGWGLTPRAFTEKAPEEAVEEGDPAWASTSVDDHLKMFADHEAAGPFIRQLRRMNRAEKIQSSYVDGFLKHLRSDGRFHPTFALHVGSLYEDQKSGSADEGGALTGRTSAKNPHVQTIPKRKKPGDTDWPKILRSCYPAPPGMLVGELDYSLGELKIAAMFSQDPTMMAAFREGKDLHVLTGAQANRMAYEEVMALKEVDRGRFTDIRYGAKAINFGKIFGQSPPGFVKYAYKQWDLIYTLEESEELDDLYFSTYDHLRGWHSAQINYAYRHGLVRNPLGRVRHLPMIRSRDRKVASKARRQAINSPVQSLLSDMGLWSIALAEETGLHRAGLYIFNFVHDALVFYFQDTEQGWDSVRQLKGIMENLPWGKVTDWRPDLKMTVELGVGENLGVLEEVDLAA